jgi:hypothetical protein
MKQEKQKISKALEADKRSDLKTISRRMKVQLLMKMKRD